MKNLKFPIAVLLLLATTAFTSCSDDREGGTSVEQRTAFVSIVEGDEEADVNEEITLNVTYVVDNLCGSFTRFEETGEADVKTVSVIAEYEDEVCAPMLEERTIEYTFKASTAGTYELKFKKSAEEFVTHTVVVE